MSDDRTQSQAALTGESGMLTPPGSDDDFVPAERRAVEDDGAHLAVTGAMRRMGERHHADPADAPGTHDSEAPNDRDGGYGSEHGLKSDDPAYRMEEPLMPAPHAAPSETELTPSEVRIDPQDDRF